MTETTTAVQTKSKKGNTRNITTTGTTEPVGSYVRVTIGKTISHPDYSSDKVEITIEKYVEDTEKGFAEIRKDVYSKLKDTLTKLTKKE